MGWCFYHKPNGVKAVDTIKSQMGVEWCEKHVVAETATREAVFLALKSHDPNSTVYVPDADGFVTALAVIAIKSAPRSEYNFGYKDMTETMGPYGCEAPLSIIAKCSELKPLVGDPEYSSLKSAIEYRARSARVAAYKALKRKLKPGSKVTLPEALSFGGIKLQSFNVERQRVRGNKNPSTVFRADNGMLCRITAKQLEGATIVEAA